MCRWTGSGRAVRRARLQALADAYGTTLQSTTTTTVHNSATTSQVDVSTWHRARCAANG